jgi:hypothetical protein
VYSIIDSKIQVQVRNISNDDIITIDIFLISRKLFIVWIMNNTSLGTTNENVVQDVLPSYQSLFPTPNTSNDIQCQPPLTMSTVNDQVREAFVDMQFTDNQPIYTVNSYIAWSILNMLFCLCYVGCIPCMFSIETKILKQKGDIQGALKASKAARKWNIFVTMFGIFIFLFVSFISKFGHS